MSLRGEWVVAFPRKYHGLGNRIRATLGSKSLAEWAGRDFAYTWPIGPAFGARLDEMWKVDDRRISVARSRLLSLRHPYRKADLDWLESAAGDRIWQIKTPHALLLPEGATPWGAQLRSLSPVDAIADRIQRFHESHLAGAAYVGVMVRAHAVSHAETLELSPVEWYIARMSEIAAARPGIRFFVSADTPSAQRAVLDAVPGAVALTDKGDYNTKPALLSSVVDLYLLAGAGHLLGPHFSSFPEIAQQLAGPTLRLETSMTDPETHWEAPDPLERAADPLRPSDRVSD